MDRPPPIDHPWVNSLRSPIYEVTFPKSPSQEDFRGYFRAIESWSKGVTQRVVWLMDGSQVTGVTASQRAEFAAFLQRMHAFDQRQSHATALVLNSALVRGIVTAVFWLHRPPYMTHVCESLEEARAWASTRARELEARTGP